MRDYSKKSFYRNITNLKNVLTLKKKNQYATFTPICKVSNMIDMFTIPLLLLHWPSLFKECATI